MVGIPNISIWDAGFDKAALCHHISSLYAQKFSLCRHVIIKKIKGIQAWSREYKILQYADDTQLFTLFNEESINAILQTFSKFSEVSGLKINFEKSEVLRIGDIRNSNLVIETDLALKWTKELLKLLGISITPNLTEVVDKNINPVIEKMCNIIKICRQRKLTLFGKITIIKFLLESQLIYGLSVLPTPKMETMRNIDKILFDYLWDKKPHKINKTDVGTPINPRPP